MNSNWTPANIMLMTLVGTICGCALVFTLFFSPYFAARSIQDKNRAVEVKKSVVETIEERYQKCINGQYASEAWKCDSLKNQWHEAVEFRKANP